MDIPKNKIKSLGKPYFSAEFIKEFIASIERMTSNPEKCYLQLTQKDDRPTLAFGCKTGHMLFDATASSETERTATHPLSAVNSIVLAESKNLTQLQVVSGARVIINYTAATDDDRKDLREYAEFLQMSLSSK